MSLSPARSDPLLAYLAEKVRGLRRQRQLSIRSLAQAAGLSERFVAQVESGSGNISVKNLACLAKALEVTPSALLEGAGAEVAVPEVIALLGLRGAGKTTVGAALARRRKVPFFELDRLVEARAGMALAEIFAIHGEGYYRRLEEESLAEFLAAHPRAVLATGGGLVTAKPAFDLLSKKTRSVWLKATPEEHFARVVEQGDLRPIANHPQAMAELRLRLKEREPLYARAEITCSTSGRSVEDVVKLLERRLAGSSSSGRHASDAPSP